MSRSSSGSYSLPANTAAVSGQTASSSKFNTLTADVAAALTDSLDRTGKGAMQAAFQATDGTVANPGIAFSGQLSTGMRRIDDNSAALVQAGADSLIFADTLIQVPDGSVGAVNLVTNGDFTSFTGWVGTNWAQVSSKAKHTAGSTSSLVQAITLVAAQKYLVTYTVSGRTAGDIQPQFQGGSTVSGTDRTTNATFHDVITAVTGNIAVAFTPSTDFDGSIDNVSVYAAALPGVAFQGDDSSGFRSRSGGIGLVVGNIDIGTVTSTGISLDAGKTLTTGGSTAGVGLQTVNLLAAGMVARASGGTPAADTTESGGTNPKTLSGYSFSATAAQGLQIAFPMPKSWDGGNLNLVFWFYAAAGAGDAVWRARAVCLADAGNFDTTSWGSFVQTAKTVANSAVKWNKTASITITPGGTAAGENMLHVELERRGNDAADTLAVATKLIAVQMTYGTNALTDD